VFADRTCDAASNPAPRLMRRRLDVADELRGERFPARQPHPVMGKIVTHVTPPSPAPVPVEIAAAHHVRFAAISAHGTCGRRFCRYRRALNAIR
jgi:hypothetical protein